MATLRQVDSGTIQLPNSSSSVTDTLGTTLLDTTKAVLYFSMRLNNATPNSSEIRGEITNTTTLTFNRNGTTGNVEITWYVVEWTAGVTVQRGTITCNASDTVYDVTISAVTMNKTFVTATLESAGGTLSSDDFGFIQLTSTTNIKFTAGQIPGTDLIVNWQAIEYDDCVVQRSVENITTETSVAITITSVNRAKTFVQMTLKNNNIAENITFEESGYRMRLTGNTTLTIDRFAGTVEQNISWEVIEFTDDTVVQEVAIEMSTSGLTDDNTITAVVTARTMAMVAGWYYSTGKGDVGSDNPGPLSVTLDLTDTTSLIATRALHGSDALSATAFVMEFPAAAPAAGGIRNPFGGPMVLRSPLGA